MIAQHLLKNRNCPQCGLALHEVLFEKDGFKFVKCNNCSLVYVPQVLAANQHATKEFDEGLKKPLINFYANSPKAIRIRRAFNFLDKHFKDKTVINILDFGCGNGFYLNFAKQLGCRNLYAVDINSYAVQNAGSIGAKSFCGNLKDWHLPGKSIDFIIMDNVIEHLENTKEALLECNRILKDGGFIFISTPNIDSFIIKMLGFSHRHFGGAEHLTYFTIKTLRSMCKEAGFKAISIRTALEEATITRMLNIALKRNIIDYDFFSDKYKETRDQAPVARKKNSILIKIIKIIISPVDFILIALTNMFNKGAYIDSFFVKEPPKQP